MKLLIVATLIGVATAIPAHRVLSSAAATGDNSSHEPVSVDAAISDYFKQIFDGPGIIEFNSIAGGSSNTMNSNERISVNPAIRDLNEPISIVPAVTENEITVDEKFIETITNAVTKARESNSIAEGSSNTMKSYERFSVIPAIEDLHDNQMTRVEKLRETLMNAIAKTNGYGRSVTGSSNIQVFRQVSDAFVQPIFINI